MPFCPLCPHQSLSLPKHLRGKHDVANVDERRLLLALASGRVNIRNSACHIPGCNVGPLRLDRHLRTQHPELSMAQREKEIAAAKRKVIIKLLCTLRATHPAVPMVTTLDLDLEVEGDLDLDLEVEAVHVAHPEPSTSAVSDIASGETGDKQPTDIHRRAREGGSESPVSSPLHGGFSPASSDAEEQPEFTEEPGVSATQPGSPQGRSRQTTLSHWRSGQGRGNKLRHIRLPHAVGEFSMRFLSCGLKSLSLTHTDTVISERFLVGYAAYQEGYDPSPKMRDNARSKLSRVKGFLLHMIQGQTLDNWRFLADLSKIRRCVTTPGVHILHDGFWGGFNFFQHWFANRYARSLTAENMTITTAKCYLLNALEFIRYVKQTPPPRCKLNKATLTAVEREVERALKTIRGDVAVHQVATKRSKMEHLPSRTDLAACIQKAPTKIEALLGRFPSPLPSFCCLSGDADLCCSFLSPSLRPT